LYSVNLYDGAADCQAHAHSPRFCREERLENAIHTSG
jgi:hypothetical protein